MIATYQGSGADITFSTDTVFEPSSAAATPAAGSAQRSGDVAPVTPPRSIAEEDIEDDINQLERKERILGRLLEYGVPAVVHACIYGKVDLEEHKIQARLARGSRTSTR